MGQFPHASVPISLQLDDQAGNFLDDVRLVVSALQILGNGIIWRAGTGDPEGVVTAPRPGSLYSRLDGPPCLYVKESGLNTNSGWVAK